jgi:hypothetical protein
MRIYDIGLYVKVVYILQAIVWRFLEVSCFAAVFSASLRKDVAEQRKSAVTDHKKAVFALHVLYDF